MQHSVSGDISSVQIPLAGNGSCYMRLFEQRVQPSFSDKRIKPFRVCLFMRVRLKQKQCHTRTDLQARQVETGSQSEGVPNAPGFQHNTRPARFRAINRLLCCHSILCACARVFNCLVVWSRGVFGTTRMKRFFRLFLAACLQTSYISQCCLWSTEGVHGSSDRSY